MNDYDPGDLPNEDPLERRRRRRRQWAQNEIDDAWAAADEDDIPDDNVEIEDLAAGYVDEPVTLSRAVIDEPVTLDSVTLDDPLEDDTISQVDLGPLPASAQRLVEERRGNVRYSGGRAHAPIEQPATYQTVAPEPVYTPSRPGRLSNIPFWGILLLVFLTLVALLVIFLAIASVLSVLN